MKTKLRKVASLLLITMLTTVLSACGGSGSSSVNKDVSLGTIVDAIKEAYGEDYLPNMLVEGQAIVDNYGITEDMYEDIYIEMPMISAQIDTLAAVKCADGKQKEVVDALTAYREYLVNDALQYPMNIPKIKASKIIEKDGFVFFVALGAVPMDVEEQGEDAILEKAEELNKIAEDVINEYLK